MRNVFDNFLDSMDIGNISSGIQKFGGILIILLIIIWVTIIIGVAKSISQRTNSLGIQILCILIATIGGPLGLIIYRIIRPPKKHIEDYYFDLHLLNCPRCGEINRFTDNYCIFCGDDLKITCKECGKKLFHTQEYCGICGAPNLQNTNKKKKMKIKNINIKKDKSDQEE